MEKIGAASVEHEPGQPGQVAVVRREAAEIQMMAECMEETRVALIQAGAISKDVAPMFVADAVIRALAAARAGAEGWPQAYGSVIRSLARITHIGTPDALFKHEAIPRSPVMDEVAAIRAAIDAYGAKIRATQPKA